MGTISYGASTFISPVLSPHLLFPKIYMPVAGEVNSLSVGSVSAERFPGIHSKATGFTYWKWTQYAEHKQPKDACFIQIGPSRVTHGTSRSLALMMYWNSREESLPVLLLLAPPWHCVQHHPSETLFPMALSLRVFDGFLFPWKESQNDLPCFLSSLQF